MTRWIVSLLKWGIHPHTVANVISDGVSLQLIRIPPSRTLPPYAILLDLRSASTGQMVRVAEVRGDTPQACATLFGQIVTIAKQSLVGSASLSNLVPAGKT